jgi:hypothetical protein
MGKNLMLVVLILLLLLALLVLLKVIHTQVVHQQAALQCHTPLPAGEPLSQLKHHREHGSYFWDAATNYGQHIRAMVYTHHA